MSVESSAPAASAPISEAPVENSNVDQVESQESLEQVQPNQTQQEIKRLKALKLKVDGQEIDEELPFEIDDNPEAKEYMTRQLQMAKMSQKRAQEAAQLRKQVEEIGEYLSQAKGDKKKLRALIRELGADEKELAAMIIEEEIANSQKSPEQLAKEQLEEELRQLKEEREREKKEWEEQERERLLGEEIERYDMLVSQAIESSDLPKSPYVVKKMADYMMLGLENDIELSPNDVIALVKEEIQADLQEMVRAMGAEKAEQFLGKEILSSIRKKNIAKAKSAPAVPVKSAVKDVGVSSKAEPTAKSKLSYKDFFKV